MSKFKTRELHETRLSTTDEKGNRVYLYPEDVKGKFRSYRTKLYYFLIILYLILPWFHYQGEQTLLLNIAERKFVFFGNIFYGHDAPLLIFVFLLIAFIAAFFTSLWGRVWCGWGCPQTVFIDSIYRPIERFFEGKTRERVALDEASLSFSKVFKKIGKWASYLAVSCFLAHTFIGYFVGTWNLWSIVSTRPESNWALFVTMLFMTGLFAFDFGWFREQFCLIACPYGRFQSVLMDAETLTVAYDTNRQNDCINCFRCVAVCPTGIDIRRGNQLECIACTQCIDACDDIMKKVDKPVGLIRYESENGLFGKAKREFYKHPRSILYLVVIVALFVGLIVTAKKKQELEALWIRSTTPFTLIENNSQKIVRNQFKLELFSKIPEMELEFIPVDTKIKLTTPLHPYRLRNEVKSVAIVFLEAELREFNHGTLKTLIDIKQNGSTIKRTEVTLVGPME